MKNGLSRAFAKVVAVGLAALSIAGLGTVAIASNSNAPASNASAASSVFNTSAGAIQLAGTQRGAQNPPPGIQPGECWHQGKGLSPGGKGMQWIDSYRVRCDAPGAIRF